MAVLLALVPVVLLQWAALAASAAHPVVLLLPVAWVVLVALAVPKAECPEWAVWAAVRAECPEV